LEKSLIHLHHRGLYRRRGVRTPFLHFLGEIWIFIGGNMDNEISRLKEYNNELQGEI